MKIVPMLDIDWPLLRQQKVHLLSAIDNASNYSDQAECEGLTGILHLLDAIQDAAAEDFGEDIVFGEMLCHNCKPCNGKWECVDEREPETALDHPCVDRTKDCFVDPGDL